ncbi:uncharacterized protein LOC114342900 [Diabrotica virgifera virgifera]|uniref:Uncharacterized protein LOC114342900 n=1 Tax=Diabrotica virgifera virgifera TaxID=50390 RepID=A0A6P7GVT9_DIAVI|nr:uncharacterized protein LOC114342900 [Diabrotica virgifera virgifera]
MAVVDANDSFLFANVGCQGRISDGSVFKNTDLSNNLENQTLNLPPPTLLPGQIEETPNVFVADDAFPLHFNIMKPYPGIHLKGSPKRAYNYRICRARRIVDNAFGILSSVFRALRKQLLLEPQKAISITLACVYLHNFLRKSKQSMKLYCPDGTFDTEVDGTGNVIEGMWRKNAGNQT